MPSQSNRYPPASCGLVARDTEVSGEHDPSKWHHKTSTLVARVACPRNYATSLRHVVLLQYQASITRVSDTMLATILSLTLPCHATISCHVTPTPVFAWSTCSHKLVTGRVLTPTSFHAFHRYATLASVSIKSINFQTLFGDESAIC